MNDQHPHAGYVGYDSHPTGSFDTDPLFGALPAQQNGQYQTTYATTYDSGYAATTAYAYPAGQQGDSGPYDSTQWDTGAHQQASYDPYAAQPHPQTAQQYDATASWTPQATGQWDSTGWEDRKSVV